MIALINFVLIVFITDFVIPNFFKLKNETEKTY